MMATAFSCAARAVSSEAEATTGLMVKAGIASE